MKALIERRAKLMAELDAMETELETRTAEQKDVEEMQAKIAEVKEIDAQIEQQKETKNLKNTKEMKVEETDMETREMLVEGKEVEIRTGMTKTNVKGEQVHNGALVTEPAKELGLKDYEKKLDELITSLMSDYGYSYQDAMLILKDILYKEYIKNK